MYLRHGGHAPMRGLETGAQSEALHIGELDFVAGAEGEGAIEEGGGRQ